jgi:hypothetical protein
MPLSRLRGRPPAAAFGMFNKTKQLLLGMTFEQRVHAMILCAHKMAALRKRKLQRKLMAASFESTLRNLLESKDKNARTPQEKRVLKALQDPSPGPLHKRRIKAAEFHAREMIGLREDIDWSTVSIDDWMEYMSSIVEFILKLMSLFK